MEKSQEILNVKTIDSGSLCWTRSALAHDQVKRWSKAKYESTQILYYVLGECLQKNRSKSKMVMSGGRSSRCFMHRKSFLESTVKQLNLSVNILPGFTTL